MMITDIFSIPGFSAATGGTGQITGEYLHSNVPNYASDDLWLLNVQGTPVQVATAASNGENGGNGASVFEGKGGAFILGMIILGMSGFRA
jgi:hypothetical protein